MKTERAANLALAQQVEQSSISIGRFAHTPGKGYRINRWRRLLRAIIGWL